MKFKSTDIATSFSYVESMMQTSHKVFHKMRKNNQKVLLVTSCAENEGKSTIASNLALYMEKHGKRVALFDIDYSATDLTPEEIASFDAHMEKVIAQAKAQAGNNATPFKGSPFSGDTDSSWS